MRAHSLSSLPPVVSLRLCSTFVGIVVAASLLAALAIPAHAASAGNATDSEMAEAPHVDLMSDSVVLLHGLGRSSWSMWIMQRRLERAGLRVVNIGYPSRTMPIDALATYVAQQMEDASVPPTGRLHFVTHSMGGIVARAVIAKARPENLGRVVMLSPPNNGSEIVDRFSGNWLFRSVMGPAAVDLGTATHSAPRRLGPADFELGVIMGTRSLNPIGSMMLDGPDDGTVSVASAKLDGMSGFLLVSASHTFIMASGDVAQHALYFLRHGRFRQI